MILAYIDPATTWLALQALLAALVAAPFLFRRSIMRVIRRFQGKPDGGDIDSDRGGTHDPGRERDA